ncbi:MAG TPA: tetratricopeptide repeat protein [Terriglobales bacterium]|nr:tetratricopeptide repeat protein [Terriglobales bacterium]
MAGAFVTSTSTFAADAITRETLADGQINDVIATLKSHTQSSPQDAEAFHLLSHAYFELEHWDDAINAEQQAVALAPDSSEYHLWLGCSYGNKAEHSSWFTALRYARRTREAFEKAVELDEKNVEARRDLSEFYILAPGFLGGGKDKAFAQAEKLKDTDAAASHWIKARAAEEDNKNDVAETEYRAAIAASANPAAEWLSLASFYRHKKRYPEMEDALNKAVAADDKKPSNVVFDAASQLLRAGRNFPLAASLANKYISEKVHAFDAPVFQAHFLLGQILEKQGDKNGAIEEYKAVLAVAGDYKRAQDALKHLK